MKKNNHANAILIITSIFFIPLNGSSMLECIIKFKGKEREACFTVLSTEKAAARYVEKIEEIKGKTSTSKKILATIDDQKEAIKETKNKHKISEVEEEVKKLKEELNKIGYKIFGGAQSQYKELNNIIKGITEDPEIKKNLDEIIKLKEEIEDKLRDKIAKIQEIGKEIIKLTKSIQETLNTLKREKLIPKEQELARKLLSKEVDEELNKTRSEIRKLYKKLIKELDLVLTSTERRRKEKFHNIVRRYKLMIKLINNPEEISNITIEKLLGLEG